MSYVSLIEIAALAVFTTFLLRGFVCGVTFFTIYVDIGKSEGISLVRELEIPGVEVYFKRELIFWLLPIASLFVISVIDPFELTYFADVSLLIMVAYSSLLFSWLMLDIVRTVNVYRNLRKIKNSTAALRKIAGTTISGLRLLVKTKGGIKKKILKESTKVVSKVSSKKLEDDLKKGEEPSKARTIATKSLEVVSKVITTPERLVDKLLELGQDRLDMELSKHFVKFEDTDASTLFLISVWSLLPSILLLVSRLLSN